MLVRLFLAGATAFGTVLVSTSLQAQDAAPTPTPAASSTPAPASTPVPATTPAPASTPAESTPATNATPAAVTAPVSTPTSDAASKEAEAVPSKPVVKCDFRVNSQISRVSDPDSIMEGKTLFHDGKAYDFQGRFEEVAMFDFEAKKVCLLDLLHRKKTIITVEQIEANAAKLQEWGTTHSRKEIKNYIAPKFEVVLKPETKEYLFESSALKYYVFSIKPESNDILEAYQMFADLSCKFNLLLAPGIRTMFGRMAVNNVLYKDGLLIEKLKVEVTFPRGLFSQKETFSSSLQYLPRLVESDFASIRQVDEYMAIFPEVTLAEYKTIRNSEKQESR